MPIVFEQPQMGVGQFAGGGGGGMAAPPPIQLPGAGFAPQHVGGGGGGDDHWGFDPDTIFNSHSRARLRELQEGLGNVQEALDNGEIDESVAQNMRVRLRTGIDPLMVQQRQAQVAAQQQAQQMRAQQIAMQQTDMDFIGGLERDPATNAPFTYDANGQRINYIFDGTRMVPTTERLSAADEAAQRSMYQGMSVQEIHQNALQGIRAALREQNPGMPEEDLNALLNRPDVREAAASYAAQDRQTRFQNTAQRERDAVHTERNQRSISQIIHEQQKHLEDEIKKFQQANPGKDLPEELRPDRFGATLDARVRRHVETMNRYLPESQRINLPGATAAPPPGGNRGQLTTLTGGQRQMPVDQAASDALQPTIAALAGFWNSQPASRQGGAQANIALQGTPLSSQGGLARRNTLLSDVGMLYNILQPAHRGITDLDPAERLQYQDIHQRILDAAYSTEGERTQAREVAARFHLPGDRPTYTGNADQLRATAQRLQDSLSWTDRLRAGKPQDRMMSILRYAASNNRGLSPPERERYNALLAELTRRDRRAAQEFALP